MNPALSAMELIALGTGNAEAVECYNSCHLLSCCAGNLLVDAGGGNGILRQLRRAGIPWQEVRNIFITHRHVDHLLGVFWLIRNIAAGMSSRDSGQNVTIYGHKELCRLIAAGVQLLFADKYAQLMDGVITLQAVRDGETLPIAGETVTFFDVGAPRTPQFGYALDLPDGSRLVSCGDEPARPQTEPYTRGAGWLLHEAYCLERDTPLVERMQGRHSTVEQAARRAQELGARNLILHHTDDSSLARRRHDYTEAACKYFTGGIFVPDDLDRIRIPDNGSAVSAGNGGAHV